MHHHTERSFVDEFRWVSPLHYKKMDDITLFFFGARCKRGRHLYTTTAPSCCIPASYCHLSATLQTISIIIVNLQDNRIVFRIFTALLRFSFDSPTYVCTLKIRCCICVILCWASASFTKIGAKESGFFSQRKWNYFHVCTVEAHDILKICTAMAVHDLRWRQLLSPFLFSSTVANRHVRAGRGRFA